MMTDRQETFTNARLVLETEVVSGSLTVRDGQIADLGPGGDSVTGVNCEGDYLVPGLVELHTDALERELMPRKGVEWPALSALLSHDAKLAGCGITTVFDAVAIGDTFGKRERAAMLERGVGAVEEAKAAGLLRADHYLHIRCEVATPNMMALYDRFGDRALVRLVSLMDHTPGARQYADVDQFRSYVRAEHRLTNDEAEAYIAERQALSARHARVNCHAIAERAKARGIVLATHDDAEPGHIVEAVALGATISEFPTTRLAAEAAHAAGLTTVLGAPNVVRGGSHNGNVSAADLASAGLLDALSSDYMPISLIEAPFRLARKGMPLAEAIAFVTVRPARMVRLEDRGRLAAGLCADFVRVREDMGAAVVRGVWREGRRVA